VERRGSGGAAAVAAFGRDVRDTIPSLFVTLTPRPTVSLDEGRTGKIEWPNTFFRGRHPADRGVVVLVGVEPNYAGAPSRTSSASCGTLGAELVVTLGALLRMCRDEARAQTGAATGRCRGQAAARATSPTGSSA
jgi:hypothetical protein